MKYLILLALLGCGKEVHENRLNPPKPQPTQPPQKIEVIVYLPSPKETEAHPTVYQTPAPPLPPAHSPTPQPTIKPTVKPTPKPVPTYKPTPTSCSEGCHAPRGKK